MRQYIIATISSLLFTASLGTASSAAVLTPDQIERKTENGIPYMSGGIGEDELEALRVLGQGDDLKLVFATKEGNYLSDAAVIIKDSNGNRVLAAIAEGPWFYTDLPAGKYLISATIQGATRQQTVHVNSSKQTQLYFYW
jgi:hypothetical protein